MDSRLTAVMCQMSLINLIEPGGGGGHFYTALPRVYVTLIPMCFGRTNLSFTSLKIQVTVYTRIANFSRLDNYGNPGRQDNFF